MSVKTVTAGSYMYECIMVADFSADRKIMAHFLHGASIKAVKKKRPTRKDWP